MKIMLCPMSDPGYLYAAIDTGLELKRRSHGVGVLARPSAQATVAAAGLPVLPAEHYGGQQAFSVALWPREGLAQYRAALRAARDFRPDVLFTSVLCHGVLLAAEVLDLPVVVLGLAAYLWNYRDGGDAEPQRALRAWRTDETVMHYARLREQVGLPERRDRPPESPLIGTALLLRGSPALEYPGAALPERVEHIGPCGWEPQADQVELNEVLSHLNQVGKPVVYVHVGRVFQAEDPWPRLNAMFTRSPFQAVIERGRSRDPRPAPEADILLVRKPWMGPLIDRAEVALTSATSAPVLAALLRGRPLGVSPGGSEQPVLAEACVRAGVALYLRDDDDHRAGLLALWRYRELRERASALGRALAGMDGARRAADATERVVTERQSGQNQGVMLASARPDPGH
jgi:UDP:flavonoid glycosyltransferase YjiC (YdhE family)